MSIRTTITVERPAGFSGGTSLPALYRHGETWEITVDEQRHSGRKDFVVKAVLLSENHHDRKVVIPGVKLGPETRPTLAEARKKARQWADVVSGQLHPKWDEKHTPYRCMV